jgi:hypothetical protein
MARIFFHCIWSVVKKFFSTYTCISNFKHCLWLTNICLNETHQNDLFSKSEIFIWCNTK